MKAVKAYVDDDLKEWVESAAKGQGRTVSNWLLVLIRDARRRSGGGQQGDRFAEVELGAEHARMPLDTGGGE